MFGTGYTKVTAEGIKHVPRDRVQIKFGELDEIPTCERCHREKSACACDEIKLRLLSDLDADLERRIDLAYELMMHAVTDVISREYSHELAGLVRQRSAAQIAKMELELRI